jgi:hypothetical protein
MVDGRGVFSIGDRFLAATVWRGRIHPAIIAGVSPAGLISQSCRTAAPYSPPFGATNEQAKAPPTSDTLSNVRNCR